MTIGNSTYTVRTLETFDEFKNNVFYFNKVIYFYASMCETSKVKISKTTK